MISVRTLAVAAGALAVSIGSVAAGPCAGDIDRIQAQIDARLDSVAGAGRFGTQSVGAELHHQPTPDSIARAEAQLGEAGGASKALAALARAREQDTIGNRPACEKEVAEAQRALGQ
jgi:hypothetical protein